MSARAVMKVAWKLAKKNTPTIMMVAGVSGMLGAMMFVAKETPAANEKLQDALVEKNGGYIGDVEPEQELTSYEKVKAIAPIYWPAAATFATSAALIIFANSLNLKRQAALMAAAELSEVALRDWKQKTFEMVDEATAEKIQSGVYKEQADRAIEREEKVYDTRQGNRLCMDSITGRLFYSDPQAIRDAVNYLNALLLEEGVACYNDFCDYLNLPHCDIGYAMGWKYSDKHDLIRVSCDQYVTNEKGDPVLVMELDSKPDYDFQRSSMYGF